MRQAQRMLKPQVINVFDNAVVQVKCIPGEDEIDVESLLGQSLARFEFIIGTSFDLQFLSMNGERLFAMRRYIVTEVVERIATSNMGYNQTLTRTVYDRKCSPIGDLVVFHEEGDLLFKSLVDEEPEKPNTAELANMNSASLQSTMKKLRGSGFPVGTTKGTMLKSIRKHLATVEE